jgi:hypothetical protein
MKAHRLFIIVLLACAAFAALGPAPASAAGLGQRCGGFIGIACNKGLWCQRPAGQCWSADTFGTCSSVPRFCNLIFKPVCGCNGKTYGNDCQRQAAQVQLAHAGKCW